MKVSKTIFYKTFDPTTNEIVETPKTITKTFKPSKKLWLITALAYIFSILSAFGVVIGTILALVFYNPYYFLCCGTALLSFITPELFYTSNELIEKEVKNNLLFASEEFDADIENKLALQNAEKWRSEHPIDECCRLYKEHNPEFIPQLIKSVIEITKRDK